MIYVVLFCQTKFCEITAMTQSEAMGRQIRCSHVIIALYRSKPRPSVFSLQMCKASGVIFGYRCCIRITPREEKSLLREREAGCCYASDQF